jgi:hypothetical protein
MRTALLLLVVLAGTAHADDARRQQMRVAAEALEKNAKATQDLAIYAACGQAYLDLYNDQPKAADGDAALYNAA